MTSLKKDYCSADNERENVLSIPLMKHNPPPPAPPRDRSRNAAGRNKGIGLVTCNIKGMVPNLLYFQKHCKQYEIVCIQEYWLWSFQDDECNIFAPEKDYFIRCSDQTDQTVGFRLPRGKGR